MKKTYDERQTMFSRARLVKGSERYLAFYKAYPEYKKGDDEVRGMDFLESLRKDDLFKQTFFPTFSNNALYMKHMYDFLDSVDKPADLVKIDSAFTQNIKAIAKRFGAKEVGIVKLDKAHYYAYHGGVSEPLGDLYNRKVDKHYTHAIVFFKPMSKDAINRSPHFEELFETQNIYLDVAYIGSRLAAYTKSLGYDSTFASEIFSPAPLVPLALDAGLGQIGMTNHIVNQTYGDRIRLGAVFTTLPLETDTPVDFGLEAFCKRCSLCLMNCPNQSIKPHKRRVNGRDFYKFDDQSCFKLWKNMGTDCGVCIQSCPYTQEIDIDTQRWMKNNPDRIDAFIKEYLKGKPGRRVSIKKPLDIIKGDD
jgi:ferredoxin